MTSRKEIIKKNLGIVAIVYGKLIIYFEKLDMIYFLFYIKSNPTDFCMVG